MKFLITGGAGFIGSALIRHLLTETEDHVVNLDALTYASNLDALSSVTDSSRYAFEHADICDCHAVERILSDHQPDAIIHLAAESHVDRSIENPTAFVQTNVFGTFSLLEAARAYWQRLPPKKREYFRFHHVSTDEVFGDLAPAAPPFTETTPYAPSSPYSASKASADHLVRAWHRTYGLPALVSNCSNNYGPYQFPEKLIPLMILNALEGKPLPVYGHGKQIRDWLYVEDHARALHQIATRGKVGETYAIGGGQEKTNLEIVQTICTILNDMAPVARNPRLGAKAHDLGRYEALITFVSDRPGHDQRYAINAEKVSRELGWTPQETLETGLVKAVAWYLDNIDWCRDIQANHYKRERLGLVEHSL